MQPRNQAGQSLGRNNPLGETPDRFHRRRRIVVVRPGESPGTMDIVDTNVDTAAAGTIRRNWRQSVNLIPAPPPFPES